jgi:threonyl-tRNA synthetase
MMVALTFPDGARRDYPNGITGFDIAKGISPSLAKRTVAMALDGAVADLADPIERDAKIEFLTRDDPRALELIRHDAAHVLAEAVQALWPGTQVTIGPVIENGFYYDFFRNQPFTPEDFDAIEKKMREIIARDKPFTKEVWSRDEAKRVFRDKGELFKVELVDAIPEDQQIKIYKQGDWFDLCRGPHMTSTGKVGNAFKLMKVAGAYWRGDSNREMLSRIYGTAFAKQEELEAYLKQIEEAEKRDHRKLGREMDLFHFQEEAPGSVFWHPKGWTLFQVLENYIRRRQSEVGYVEVNSPQLVDSSLWVASGHMATFRENMFLTQPREEDERIFVVKPMNCPGHIQIFKNGLKSYRDLPFKLAEFGKVHRFEPSGALHGLMRVRAFTQDDAHVFITDEQIADESLKMNDLILSIYEDFGFPDVTIKFSDRPEKRIGDDAVWDKAEAALMQSLKTAGRPWSLNKGEGAFYGPKLEYVLRDAIGRDWQCGTVQVDLNMPGRLGAFYIDEHSNKVTPVMLHRAMFGSLERFIGILIEHFGGHLPLWLSPLQAVVATITDDADGYAREVIAAARRAGLRVEEDLRNEKINYKVREHSLAKVPALLVVGRKEAAERTVSIRRLGKDGQTVLPLDAALKALADEAVPPDVRVKQPDSKQTVGGPEKIEIDVRSASLRQIHDAIDHLHKSDYVSAITLASAAEGILPHTDNPHLFQKLKALTASIPEDPNAFTNWTKHGTHNKATISELEVIATIVRATSKFTALYDEQSQKMKDFSEWAIARLQADKK